MSSGVLGLDLGLTTGFCFGEPGSLTPTFGCIRLPGPECGYGERLGRLTNGISDLIVRFQPRILAKEAIIRLAAQNSAHVARLQFGYQACADEEGWRHSVEVVEEDADKIRLHVMGRSRWPKGVEVKPQIVQFVRQYGFDCHQHDQADAIVVWLWACRKYGAKLRQKHAA